MKTYFASPERSDKQQLAAEIEIVSQNPIVSSVLHSVGGLLAVLNEHRQIIAINDSFLKMLGISDPSEALGLRPGEAVGCIHAHEEEAGCGTSKFCSTCGAAIAIVTCQEQNIPVERTCAIQASRGGETIDVALSIRCHPLTINNSQYQLLFVTDITAQEQRAALERTFFHDVNNALTMLVQASELLQIQAPSQLAEIIHQASLRLHKEIEIQRCLSTEQHTTYQPLWSRVKAPKVFNDLNQFFSHHKAAGGKKLVFKEPDEDFEITTDISALYRILINMIVNALEATEIENEVKIWIAPPTQTYLTFCVWNDAVIPQEIQKRIFQRNFSTKNESGRGIGTYSMKLFGEGTLGGKVTFSSSPEEGTLFRFSHPI